MQPLKLRTTFVTPFQEARSFTDLRKVQLPTSVFLCVEAIRPGNSPQIQTGSVAACNIQKKR